jgi:predicted secreted hydrolase
MWRWVLVGAAVLVIVLLGFSLVDISGSGDVSASAVIDISQDDISGYARAVDPYSWKFPADFGEHPEFQTEWWYYTGNLLTDSGQRFGFQFTVFRRALSPVQTEGSSEWRTDQVYMAHFTVSDVAAGKFYQDERYSRGGAGLAGAVASPRYHVWLENWEILALNDDATQTTIRAASSDFAVDLTLKQVKPPALQGNNGLSPKSIETGNASYYYSLSRLITNGTVTVEGKSYSVEGVTWKDHEFSTSALGGTAKGWDWFGLIFDNNTELMLGQIRLLDGGKEPAFGGLLIQPDGSTVYLPSNAFTITAKDTWTSPHTGAVYPAGWDIMINHQDIQLSFTVTPAMPDQELYGSGVVYWEGAADITGDVTGVGYAELTGYVDTMQGRF